MESNARITKIFARLLKSERVNLYDVMEEFDTSSRTVQRDMSAIKRALINPNPTGDKEEKRPLPFKLHHELDSEDYYLTHGDLVSFDDIFAILKVVLGARVFKPVELQHLLDIFTPLVGTDKQVHLDKLSNFVDKDYLPVNTTDNLIERIAMFRDLIAQQTLIGFYYINSSPTGPSYRKHFGVPLDLYYSNGHFYVIIYSQANKDHAEGSLVYRLDRFRDDDFTRSRKSIPIPRDKRESETSIRQKSYLLNSGQMVDFSLIYYGYEDTVLSQLPNAKIKRDENNKIVKIKDKQNNRVGIYVSGRMLSNGLNMWVRSQGDLVVVQYPQSIIDDITATASKILNYYK